MSRSERDATRIVRLWLEEGVTALPDRILDVVLDQLPTTPQRRPSWLARRSPIMTNTVRLIAAAAAVVVVALIGYQLLIAPNVGGPGPVPSPTASPTPAAPPLPSEAGAVDFPPSGPLAGGSYSMTKAGVSFSIDFPAGGWVSDGSFRIYQGPVPGSPAFVFWDDAPDGVYADPCAHVQAPPAGPSIADLAAAVSTLPGTDLVSGPTDVTVDGQPAKYVVIALREDVACGAGPDGMYLWWDEGIGGFYPDNLGDTLQVWIIDVGGATVWIDGESLAGATDVQQELQQIVDSIQFE
ncbi:MAG: hypothetical protein ACRDFZ_02570 [Candidatus Limnocylindria bacterium]